MNAQTISKPYTELKTGDIVHFYGARFKIESTQLIAERDQDLIDMGRAQIMSARGVWIDGAEVGGYFGANKKDWHFQGNSGATCAVEA